MAVLRSPHPPGAWSRAQGSSTGSEHTGPTHPLFSPSLFLQFAHHAAHTRCKRASARPTQQKSSKPHKIQRPSWIASLRWAFTAAGGATFSDDATCGQGRERHAWRQKTKPPQLYTRSRSTMYRRTRGRQIRRDGPVRHIHGPNSASPGPVDDATRRASGPGNTRHGGGLSDGRVAGGHLPPDHPRRCIGVPPPTRPTRPTRRFTRSTLSPLKHHRTPPPKITRIYKIDIALATA